MTFYFTPSRRMASIRQAMDRMIEESLAESRDVEREMLLAVDVQASDEGYEINALVPGLEADDLEIEIINNTITLRGQFKSTPQENAKYLLNELPDPDSAHQQHNQPNPYLPEFLFFFVIYFAHLNHDFPNAWKSIPEGFWNS